MAKNIKKKSNKKTTVKIKKTLINKNSFPHKMVLLEFGSVSMKVHIWNWQKESGFIRDAESKKKIKKRMREVYNHSVKLRHTLSQEIYEDEVPNNSSLKLIEEYLRYINNCIKELLGESYQSVLVVATAVFRDLKSRHPEFYKDLEEVVGNVFNTRINLLDGAIEAQMIAAAAREILRQLEEPRPLFFDLGGASLELVWMNHESTHTTSIHLGAARVTAWIKKGTSITEIMDRIEGHIDRHCSFMKEKTPSVWRGTGGAAKALTAVFNRQTHFPIFRDEIESEFARIKDSLFDENGDLQGRYRAGIDENGFNSLPSGILDDHRKAIYPGGVFIIHSLFNYFNISAVKVQSVGLSEGLAYLLNHLNPDIVTSPSNV